MKPILTHLHVSQFEKIIGTIKYWMHDGEWIWFKRTWSMLRSEGLTYYLDETSRCIVLIRGLALARLLRTFHYYFDAWIPSEFTYTLENFDVEREKEEAMVQFYGFEDFEELLHKEYEVVSEVIMKKMGNDDTEIFLFFYRSLFPKQHPINKNEVLNYVDSSKLEAYNWIQNGCDYI